MKNIKFIAACLLFFIAIGHSNAQTSNKVEIGTIDSLQSNILGEQRKVWVYVPAGANLTDPSASQKYPVVYLLDGDAHFYSVVGMIQQLSQVNGNVICPEMIVVGIPNTDRTRDLTPTHTDVDPFTRDSAAFLKTSGGGENFIAFMEKELMPFIESKYPTAPYKMLIGHSLGGLLVMQTLAHHNHLFNSYICIDPSMWYDNKKLLNETKTYLKTAKLEGKSLYLGIANTMDEGMDINKVTKDTSVETGHIRAILELQTAFEKSKQNGLRYKGKYYADDSHGSVPLIAEYDALRFFFDFHDMKFGMKDFTDTTTALVTKFEKHYANISKNMGYKISPPEQMINMMGYDFLMMKQYTKAGGFFKMNVDNYPNSANAYDSYSDYFIAIGDKANAMIQLKKALAMKENEGSRKKLTQLEIAKKWTTTQWGIIGTATPNNWDADQPMTYDVASNTWKITLHLKSGEFKFRANGTWDVNLGGSQGDTGLKFDGNNLKLAADGNYTVSLLLNVAGNYSYKLVKN
jgi:uncharacterized protein